MGVRRDGSGVIDRVDLRAGFEEALFLGLRLVKGVELLALRAEFGELVDEIQEVVVELCGAGLMELEDGWLRLTARGRMVSNEVFERLILIPSG